MKWNSIFAEGFNNNFRNGVGEYKKRLPRIGEPFIYCLLEIGVLIREFRFQIFPVQTGDM
jgi:hypothetical protein